MLRNMMASSVLYLLVIVAFSGVYSQYLDANNCVRGKASFNASSGRCECNPGLVGVGDLCCSQPNTKDVCYLSGDPILTSVYGQKVPINMPCSICIAVVESEAASGEECVLEVLASSTVNNLGAIYTSSMRIGVSINKGNPVYIGLTGENVEIEIPRRAKDILQPSAVRGTGYVVTVAGERVTVKYDAAAKIWSLEGCQSKVSLRPQEPGSKLTPGTCIQAKEQSIKMSVESGNICGLRDTYDNSIPRAYGVLGDALNTRQIFGLQQARSHPDYTSICEKIDGHVRNDCPGITKEAADQCGAILYNAAVRACLIRLGTTGPGMLTLFGSCIETFCLGFPDRCDDFGDINAIKTCLPSFTRCNEWPYYLEPEPTVAPILAR